MQPLSPPVPLAHMTSCRVISKLCRRYSLPSRILPQYVPLGYLWSTKCNVFVRLICTNSNLSRATSGLKTLLAQKVPHSRTHSPRRVGDVPVCKQSTVAVAEVTPTGSRSNAKQSSAAEKSYPEHRHVPNPMPLFDISDGKMSCPFHHHLATYPLQLQTTDD